VKLPLARMPDWVLPAAGLFDRLNALMLGTPRTSSPEVIRMLRGKRYNASNRRARQLLGWSPRIGLRESLKDTMDAFRAREAR
jgi:nucleoside-diphosphate-sugar epimerase